MKAQTLRRWCFYAAGLLLLALGLTLNTQTGLGASPIISVSYTVAVVFQLPFGDVTFLQYGAFVAIQLWLHWALNRCRKRQGKTPRLSLRQIWIMDLLQLPLSLAFTRFLNLFSTLLPDLSGSHPALRLLALLAAITLTGIGAAMSLDMRLVPNPGDGIVQALADFFQKPVGLAKNAFDALNILLALILGFLWAGGLVGVGLGTLCAVVGVGRVIAVFQRLWGKTLCGLTGVPF